MKRSYLDYAMSVIVARALPDARDGLKPVHRRILYSMHEQGHTPDKKYVKSARVVGDVMGKYHPHGDQAIYDALVRMAQDFSMRLPLIDGQGNFGSVDGDPPAAMRYTECRLAKPAMELLEDIDKDTVDFQPNYDGNEKEPAVLPARFPNLLVNGAGGIAVGMATNIPPHNLGEVIDACDCADRQSRAQHRGPHRHHARAGLPDRRDHPGPAGIRAAYHLGRGSIVMRGKVEFETLRGDREAIIVSEIPYQVNKATMVERIGELWRDKKIEGISALRDESDRDGYRVVIEIKRDAMPDVVLNQLYRYHAAAIDLRRQHRGARRRPPAGDEPEGPAHVLRQLPRRGDFAAHQVSARQGARPRPHPGRARHRGRQYRRGDPADPRLQGRQRGARSLDGARLGGQDRRGDGHADRRSAPPRDRRTAPRELSAEQAKAILDLRLQRLTALGRDEIKAELDKLADEIADYLDILRSRARIQAIVKDELAAVKKDFATPRRTVIVDQEGEMEDEDLIQREDMVVTVSHLGYVKRVPLSTYRAQRRGGKGRAGMQTRDEDFVSRLFVAKTHTPVLFFSSHGRVYKEKVWRLPQAAPQARGKALINILPLEQGERVTTVMPLPEDEKTWAELDVMFATTRGTVRRNKLSDFVDVRRSGIIAMKLDEGEGILDVQVCTENDDVLLTSAGGQCIRFPVTDVRVFQGRTSMGVRGIALGEGDKVISLTILRHVDATGGGARRLSQARQRGAPRHQWRGRGGGARRRGGAGTPS